MFPKDNFEAWFVTSISNVAVERDFYAIESDRGFSQDLERRLAAIDGEACAALDGLGSGVWPPSDHDHDIIANFIALQITRGQDFPGAADRHREHHHHEVRGARAGRLP